MKLHIHKILLFLTLGVLIGCHEGTLTTDNYSTGQIRHLFYVRDNKIVGVDKEYYINGQLKLEANYVDGKKEGLVNQYYEDGHLSGEFTFRNDKQVDTMKLYFDNGKPMEISYFVDGYQSGPFTDFYSNGTLKMKGNCIKGNGFGIFRLYDSVTGLLSNVMVCDTTGGVHHFNGDSNDFKLTRISTKDSDMYISVPSKWLVKYNWNINYKNHPVIMRILAVKMDKIIDTSKYKLQWNEVSNNDTAQTMIIILADTYSTKTAHEHTAHEVMSISMNDSKKSGETMKAFDIGDFLIGNDTAAVCRRLAQYNGVQCAITEMGVRHNNTFYHIMCKTSSAKFAYYADLFDEIIKGITFTKNKTT